MAYKFIYMYVCMYMVYTCVYVYIISAGGSSA
jgi:hypothetical protein